MKLIPVRWLPFGFKDITIGRWWIFIHRDYLHDAPLIAHAGCHGKQFEAQPWSFWLMYFTCRHCRLRFEVEAYRVQLAMQPEPLRAYYRRRYAEFLATRYWLGVSVAEGEGLLGNSEH